MTFFTSIDKASFWAQQIITAAPKTATPVQLVMLGYVIGQGHAMRMLGGHVNAEADMCLQAMLGAFKALDKAESESLASSEAA